MVGCIDCHLKSGQIIQEPDLESKAIEANDAPAETSPLALSKPQGTQHGTGRQRLVLTAISAQREQRILEWL